MKAFVVAALLAAGCSSSQNYPVVGGGGGGAGGGGGGGGVPDAASDGAAGDGGTITGRVCLLADPRNETACAPSGVLGVTVKLGTSTATTADDGSFTMATPAGSNLVWALSGTKVVPSVMPYGTTTTLPALGPDTYQTLEDSNGVVAVTGQGAIMTRITIAGTPATGAVVSVTPAPAYAAFYAGNSATQWNQSTTDASGTAWVPGIDATQVATLAVTAGPTGTSTGSYQVTVPDGGIAFVAADLSP